MRLGLIVNDVRTEKPGFTTTHLAMAAMARGHDVWHIGLADLSHAPDECVYGVARRPPRKRYRSDASYLNNLWSDGAISENLNLGDLDILMLRNDPAEDFAKRPWARLAGINFGRLAQRNGVIVLNDPDGLYHAINKMYLQHFPAEVRPHSLISRDKQAIKDFAHEQGGMIVLKPLTGSGGRNVFLVRSEDLPNLNQMIEAVLRDGYALAQEYVEGAEDGDTRIYMMNGQILEHQGLCAAVHRHSAQGDMRSNLRAGGVADAGSVTDDVRRIADMVRPRLVQDGMFLVGLDIVGSKLLEINVFTPGALVGASQLAGVNFLDAVVDALERKVAVRQLDPNRYTNTKIAMM